MQSDGVTEGYRHSGKTDMYSEGGTCDSGNRKEGGEEFRAATSVLTLEGWTEAEPGVASPYQHPALAFAHRPAW